MALPEATVSVYWAGGREGIGLAGERALPAIVPHLPDARRSYPATQVGDIERVSVDFEQSDDISAVYRPICPKFENYQVLTRHYRDDSLILRKLERHSPPSAVRRYSDSAKKRSTWKS